MSDQLVKLLFQATLETLYMVFLSGLIVVLIGLPLGVILYGTRKNSLMSNVWINKPLAAIIDITRSVPFIILLIFLTPFTRLIVGSSIGTNAALIPLIIGAIPFVARVVESSLLKINSGLIEAGLSMGANSLQIFTKIMLPEALPGIIHGITLMLIGSVGYAAMAGAVGGGGLGSVAINYGYQRFDTLVMLYTTVILVLIVHLIQWTGEKIAARFSH